MTATEGFFDTDCARCRDEWEERNQHLPFSVLLARRMYVCSECGSKRCPKAWDHRNQCEYAPPYPPPDDE